MEDILAHVLEHELEESGDLGGLGRFGLVLRLLRRQISRTSKLLLSELKMPIAITER